MGRNGSGKSSLLWALQGSGPRRPGSVLAESGSGKPRDTHTMAAAEARRLVGLVPQTPADLLYLESVKQELDQADAESGTARGGSEGARAILGRLAPGIDGATHPRDLSEGQKLALVLAVQLTATPRVLLLDEPTRGLDYRAKTELTRIVSGLASEGRAVVISTHDVEFVARTADRVVVMAEGDIVADGPTPEVIVASPVFAPQTAKILSRCRSSPSARWLRPKRTAPRPATKGTRHECRLRDGHQAHSAGLPGDHPGGLPRRGGLLLALRRRPRKVRLELRPAPHLRRPAHPRALCGPVRDRQGGINSKALAMLGVLSAVNAALRPLGAGTAGIETVFFVLVLAGRVYGPGFGFTLGCTSLFASALITGGVGPWMPYQMFGCAFVGMLAGFLPRARGRREVLMLAAYGSVSGYLFGFLLNLSFWPFSLDPNSSIAYLPGLPFTQQWNRYLAFDLATSLGWDTGRAVTNFVCIVLAGPAVLITFRRAARRARFQAPVRFTSSTSAVDG